ncbi:LacI family DNA-binding transcriptional regulator [Stappia sp.]|uniref:LacI family DNA-binding transcriptional regulator n=1 Tax=Stappia sp. TaxID=1870903 RepID=UPI0032D95D50
MSDDPPQGDDLSKPTDARPAPPEDAQGAAGAGSARARRVTLGDMAESLGVSTATVSLALRDSPLVAAKTRSRIKAHARQVGYIYNRSAAALRTARSNMVAVAVHDILNPYFAEVFRALEEALGRENQVVLICNHRDDPDRQRRFIDSVLQHRIDGLILSVAVGTTAQEIDALAETGVPVTLICRDLEGARVPVVRGDDFAGGRLVTGHLIAQGHRRIAMIGGRRESSAGRARAAGWRAALADAGLDPAAQIDIPEAMTQADGRAVVPRLLAARPRPTALFAFNDLIAQGLYTGLRRAGLVPGRDMAVAGYDDTDAAEGCSPALTSVWNGAEEIGRRAAELILRQVAGAPVAPERLLIAPRLCVRDSTPPPPAGETDRPATATPAAAAVRDRRS